MIEWVLSWLLGAALVFGCAIIALFILLNSGN
jgi:hypothetical protein